jgi:hypothetical protein
MLAGFIISSCLSVLMIAATSLLTYEILGAVWNLLPRLSISRRLRVLLVIMPIFIIHIANIWFYASVCFLIENFSNFGALTGNIGKATLTYESFIERLYYSASTYASLGLGDIVPTGHLRMLASAEVLNGLVLLGWTISFTYLTMEEFWSLPYTKKGRS